MEDMLIHYYQEETWSEQENRKQIVIEFGLTIVSMLSLCLWIWFSM
jgi:hypothetical protein